MLHLDAALRHKLVAPGNFWLHGSMAQHLTVPRASNASMARHAKSVVLRQAHQRDLRRFTSQEVSRSDGFTIQEVANLAKQPMFEAPQPYQRTRGIASDRACKQDCNRTGLGFQNLWSVTPGSCCCPCHSGSHGAVHFGEL